MRTQKFRRGDLVHIAKITSEWMAHFDSDLDAIVMGSYKDQFGGDNVQSYTLLLLPRGSSCSWYEEHQLTKIGHVGEEGIKMAKEQREKQDALHADLDWIISNWPRIRDEGVPGASMGKLAELAGGLDLWGSSGEGFTYYTRSKWLMHSFDAALLSGNRKTVEKRGKTIDLALRGMK